MQHVCARPSQVADLLWLAVRADEVGILMAISEPEILMTKFDPLREAWPRTTRRDFLYGAGAGLFVLGAARNLVWAQSAAQSVMSGTEFDLQIGEIRGLTLPLWEGS